MNICWIGPVSNSSLNEKNSVLSPAANNWQKGLISGLRANGCDVRIYSYIPFPFFPKGPFHVTCKNEGQMLQQQNYFNIPFLRAKSLTRSYIRNLKEADSFDAVVTYNNLPHFVNTARNLQTKKNTPWIQITADDEYVRGADLYVFLSYGYFERVDVSSKIHIDGGMEDLISTSNNEEILHYSGSLNRWTGIEKFAKQFAQLSVENLELHIYGKGNSSILNTLDRKENCITLKGFVPKEVLHKARKNAFAFVNPRPTEISGGENNFPSKILEYLRYGKPIISTYTKGLSPEYESLLYFYNPDNINSLNNVIDEVFNLKEHEISKVKDKITTFYKTHTWNHQAKRLLNHLFELRGFDS